MEPEKIKISWDEIESPSPSTCKKISISDCLLPDGSTFQDKRFDSQKRNYKKFLLVIPVLVAVALIIWILFFKDTSESSIENQKYRRAIEVVLQQYKNFSGESVSEICQQMSSVDLSKCPAEFQMAYQTHAEAWSKKALLLQECEELDSFEHQLGDFCVGVLAGITGQFHVAVEYGLAQDQYRTELQQMNEEINTEIKTTYRQLLQIARKYNVDVTQYSN